MNKKREYERAWLIHPSNRIVGTCSLCNGKVWYIATGEKVLWCQACQVYKVLGGPSYPVINMES